MKKHYYIILLAGLMLCVVPMAYGFGDTQWHVSPHHFSDVEDGSYEHPFHSIADAINAASNNDKIRLASGFYDEVITVENRLRLWVPEASPLP